jgi:tRNA(Ile)-lysidine synthase
MNLIADEDDLLEHMASDIASEQVQWLHHWDECGEDYGAACVLLPGLGEQPLPLQRRVVVQVLQRMLPAESRIETAAVDAVLAAWEGRGVQKIRSGYVTNIQGNLAVSANKQGVRIEAMEVFRARRKRS